ncbi:MAG: hypothetical protein IJ855_04335 [Bacteroidales bacterium]|nr:hypothetical protein [Bacteroidales bacterium]
MPRRNRRKRYRGEGRLGFNPDKYISRNECGVGSTGSGKECGMGNTGSRKIAANSRPSRARVSCVKAPGIPYYDRHKAHYGGWKRHKAMGQLRSMAAPEGPPKLLIRRRFRATYHLTDMKRPVTAQYIWVPIVYPPPKFVPACTSSRTLEAAAASDIESQHSSHSHRFTCSNPSGPSCPVEVSIASPATEVMASGEVSRHNKKNGNNDNKFHLMKGGVVAWLRRALQV